MKGFEKPTTWTSGKVQSNKKHLVSLDKSAGLELTSDTEYYWKVSVWLSDGSVLETVSGETRKTHSFRTGLSAPTDFKGQWITGGYENNLLRTEYTHSDSSNSTSIVYVSGIGYYSLFINGEKVGDHELDTGWTDYSKRVYYNTFDVSDMLVEGKNTLAVMLGNGWFSCGDTHHPTTQPGCVQSPPQLFLQLNKDEPAPAP